MGKRYQSPFSDTKKMNDLELPFIRGNRILIKDERLIARLQHVARPFRGGETLDYSDQPKHENEPCYVDLEMLCSVLLNEVVHLREQIGLVCEGAYLSSGRSFKVHVGDKHETAHGAIEGRNPRIEDFTTKGR